MGIPCATNIFEKMLNGQSVVGIDASHKGGI